MDPLDKRTARKRHHRAAAIAGALAVIVLLVAATAWEPTAIALLIVNVVWSIVYLSYLAWAIATGRIGIVHWAPTARRQRRLAGRAAEKARLEQQRLDAATSYGSYRPTAGRAQYRDLGRADP
jgi:hypothetical protein